MKKIKVGGMCKTKSGRKVKVAELNSGCDKKFILVEYLDDMRGHGHNGNGRSKGTYTGNNMWYFREKDLTPISGKEIHITQDGNTVHAVLKDENKIVKRSKAVCSPKDEFDFETGARLAIDRLFEKVDIVGMYARVTTSKKNKPECCHNFNIGDIVKILGDWGNGDYMVQEVSCGWTHLLGSEDFEILETEKRYAKTGEYILLTNGVGYSLHRGEIYKVTSRETFWTLAQTDSGMIGSVAYVVLKNYKPFVPHLEYKNDENYGEIGDLTPLRDVRGEVLYVGDIVTLIDKDTGKNYGKRFIVSNDLSSGRKHYFVMGICSECGDSGKIHGWVVVKEKSYKDLDGTEELGDIRAVLEG